MNTPKTWLAGKLSERCACGSRQSYSRCCCHRESVYLVLGIVAALALFGAHEIPELLIAVPILVVVAFVAKLYFDRKRRNLQNDDDLG